VSRPSPEPVLVEVKDLYYRQQKGWAAGGHVTQDSEHVDPGSRSAGYRSRTALLFAGAEIVGKLASFGMFAVATRILGPEGFGEFSWALGLGMMAASLGMFGFDMALIQLGGAHPSKTANYLTSSITLRLAIAVLVVSVLALWPLNAQGSKAVLLLMATALSLENISLAVRSAAGVLDRQRGAAVNIIIQRVAIAAIAIGVLVAGGGVLGMAAAFLTGTAIGTVAMLVLAHRIGATPHPRYLNWPDTKALTIKSILPGAANTMNMQTTRVDVIALGRGGNYTSVGYFSSAYKLMETSLFLSDSLIRAAMPAMLYAKNSGEVGRILRTFFATASVFYIPLAVVMVARGGELLALLFGAEFGVGGRSAIIALAWALLALVSLSVFTTALLVRNHSADVAAVALATMIVKLVIVWPLVDRYGSLGAGIAVSVAFTTQALLLFWRLTRYGCRPHFGVALVPAVAGGAVMVPVLITDLALVPALLVAGLAFVAMWGMTARWLDPQSIERVRALIGK
jgi:O-antigen/teichoic acid export membrane protein